MRRTDFFIVGAPKCGTTALAVYLNDRPDIVMTESKEPHFFATDIPGYREVTSIDDYLGLFGDFTGTELLGDASVFHLYSSEALKNILDFNSHSKIIAMLRNPVDLAYSFHSQMLYTGDESIENFEDAWRAIDDRRLGLRIPTRCRDRKLLLYDEVVRLGRQVQELYKTFPKEQVRLILFDDFVSNTSEVYAQVVEFLALPQISRTDFPRLNQNRRHRSKTMADLLFNKSRFLKRPVRLFKKMFGVKEIGFLRRLRRLETKHEDRPPLCPRFRSELLEGMSDDVRLLETLIERDLSHWLTPAERETL